jgi:Lhr-like helicase
MRAIELLRKLHDLEKPLLQTNDWDRLRVPVRQLIDEVTGHAPQGEVLKLLQELRLEGALMLLPDWERWTDPEEDATDGSLLPSKKQWQPELRHASPLPRKSQPSDAGHEKDAPTWSRRDVFLPKDLEHWYLRSRVAEVLRLLSTNRERFGLEASTAHVSYELQERRRPDRHGTKLEDAVSMLRDLATGGALSRAEKPDVLARAIEIVAAAFGRNRTTTTLASFQVRAWDSILHTLFGTGPHHRATMVTAGVSSGKTFSFVLPALTLLVYRALLGQGGKPRVLIIYPRTSLVEDQHRVLTELLGDVNAELERSGSTVELTTQVALDAGQMLGDSLGDKGSLAEVLPKVKEQRVEVILTTPESLKNRMLDPRAVKPYLANMELIVFDEIHLMEGLAGTHGIYFVRRLRHIVRSLRGGEPDSEPAWVGASATVAEPVKHAERIFSLEPGQVQHVMPRQNELVRFGTFHHALLHTRVGKPSIAAVTNGLSCLVHNRNNSTAHSHYVDPAVEPLVPRPTDSIEKTLVFVDSLTTIGRLRFTTSDNENCINPGRPTAPYYAWFYQPASRHEAPRTEEKELGAERLKRIRDWCRDCHKGKPALLATSDLDPEVFATLRTGRFTTESIPGFEQTLQDLPERIGNLDQCPYLKERLCWWFSQDAGVRRPLARGQIDVRIDQNRAIAYTSKTEEEIELHKNVNDYFLVEAREIWPQPLPAFGQQTVSTLLASPRIEVGVDFKNVRDGATHKALRSAASFQQKTGRVGREDDTDSVIVTFLAQRPTDAHFAHQPKRLIDPLHLDPIPLKDENPDVLKHHLFAAVLEWIASRGDEIPAYGSQLDIIGPDSVNVPEPWDDKVRACLEVLQKRRGEIKAYLLEATRQPAEMGPVADDAIDTLLRVLRLFVVELDGTYSGGGTPASWFKANRRPHPEPRFEQLVSMWPAIEQSLARLLPQLTGAGHAAANALWKALDTDDPSAAEVQQRADALRQTAAQSAAHIEPALAGELFMVVSEAIKLSSLLSELSVSAPLRSLAKAHDVIKAFFLEPSDGTRRMTQYYLHDLLTGLVPFRDTYPFGLVRTHFQHVNERQVRVSLGRNEETESIGVALYELLPGTWNYRWNAVPRKSLCGLIDAHEHGIRLDDIPGAVFRRMNTEIPVDELPTDMPGPRTGPVPIYRPDRLVMRQTIHQPRVRRDNNLVGDDDESPMLHDPRLEKECPTLPRAVPATWFRVNSSQGREDVVGEGAPTSGIPHTFPAFGRALLERVTRTSRLQLDRYVYALDRVYGIEIQSPRLHYQWGKKPVVLGDSFEETDAVILTMKDSAIQAVLDKAWSLPRLRAELTARALYQFIIRSTRCNAFEATMLRKLILAAHLAKGGTLTTLDPAACAREFSMDVLRQEQLSRRLLDGVFSGLKPGDIGDSRGRQEGWYEKLRPFMLGLASQASDFDDALVQSMAREILIHSFAVLTLEATGRLVGAAERDVGYFFHAGRGEAYVFDMVEGGNGCSETAARFFQIPPLRRRFDELLGDTSGLPSSDGFKLLQEALASCPSQLTTRLIFETCLQTVADPTFLNIPREPVEDLEARIRHEYDLLNGSRPIIDHLRQTNSTLFSTWEDLLWLELVPEWFAADVVRANVCANFESMRSRTHLCITGCLECVDNGEASLYGVLASREHVSRNLLELLKEHAITSEPDAYLRRPPGTKDNDPILRAHADKPLTDAQGSPLKVKAEGHELSVTRRLSSIEPDPSQSSTLLIGRYPRWDVRIPVFASFRDEVPKE